MDENLKNFDNFESNYLEDILDNLSSHLQFSLMSQNQRQFINGIVRKLKPKKILEVGVFAGVNSAIILNAIKDIDNSMLYSVDLAEYCDRDNDKLTVFIVDEKCHNLKNKWKIYRGNVIAKFIEEIGNDIELCILDTAHSNPGEFLDFIMIAPFLAKNAVVIIHDIELHNISSKYGPTCGTLFSCLKGKKFYPLNDGEYNYIFGFPNIGAVKLDSNFLEYIEDIFFLLTLPWSYIPSQDDQNLILDHLNKYYDKQLVSIYVKILEYTKIKPMIINNNEIAKLNRKTNIIINTLAWWIPIKKWRDNFRSKFEN